MAYYVVKVLLQVQAEDRGEASDKVFNALENQLIDPSTYELRAPLVSFAVREAECVGSQSQFILGLPKG